MKIDSLLTRQRIIGYSRVILITIIITLFLSYIVGYIDITLLANVDFAAFYTAGLMLSSDFNNDKANLYDYTKQLAIQVDNEIIDDGDMPTIFLNPPFYAWLMVPLSKISYIYALNIWRLVMVGVAYISIAVLKRQLKLRLKSRDIFTVFLASFPAFAAILLGQNTFLFIGLYTLSYILLLKKHDYGAGFILGLGVLKPQLFLFCPIVLMFQKKWNALLGLITGCLLIAIASVAIVGVEANISYLTLFEKDIYLLGIQDQAYKMHSIPAFFRLLFGLNSTYIALVTCFVLNLMVWYWSYVKQYKFNAQVLISLSIIGSILISPHLFHYDLSLLLLPYIFIYSWTKESGIIHNQNRNYRITLAVLYPTIWISMITAEHSNFQVSVFLILVLFVYITYISSICLYYT